MEHVLTVSTSRCQALRTRGTGVDTPDLLADLQRPDKEGYAAVADLKELGLIEGIDTAERDYAIMVLVLDRRRLSPSVRLHGPEATRRADPSRVHRPPWRRPAR